MSATKTAGTAEHRPRTIALRVKGIHFGKWQALNQYPRKEEPVSTSWDNALARDPRKWNPVMG